MKVSALERILVTERVRPQTAVVTKAGFARPVLYEQEVEATNAPFLVTNMRGSFLPTRRSIDGVVRLAFVECPLFEEDRIISELYTVLWEISVQQGWPNRCSTMRQARDLMGTFGTQPKAFIVGPSFLSEAVGVGDLTKETVDKLMLIKGHVAEVGGIKVLASELSEGRAILSTTPSQVGTYVRSGDYLGVLIFRADQSLVLVGE